MPVASLHAAAELLASADSAAGIAAIARSIGCDGDPAPLDKETQRALGLDDAVVEASVATGRGALRALLLTVRDDAAIREVLPRYAGRLATRAAHALWVLVATQRAHGEVVIAAWSNERRPPRVAAVVVNRRRPVDSDAETLRALSVAAGERDVLTHMRWVEILGRDSLTARFYQALERAVSALADSSSIGPRMERHEAALLDASRLVFLAFLEAKGWLDGDRGFLVRHFDRCAADGGRFHERVLRPLFFGTLNTPFRRRARTARAFGRVPFLNGGLFAKTGVERRLRGLSFSDDAYGTLLFDVFGQYRFTAREETSTWTEAAVDPEMLGRAFESLMAPGERRRTGAFFTPFSLVERVSTSALASALDDDGQRALAGEPLADARARAVLESIERLTVLDPACGSGAFLVHALERIASLRSSLGDGRDVSTIRREVLTRSIFGVDVNPTAVWLCELRLWLSVVIESEVADPLAVTPLPNLDRNVRVGDALLGRAFGSSDLASRDAGELHALRERYARATGRRKATALRRLERAERVYAIETIGDDLRAVAAKRRDALVARRGRDLFGDRYRPSRDERLAAAGLRSTARALRVLRRRIADGGALPFGFRTHFPDVAARGGFGVVVGNPPWVRVHRVPESQRKAYRRDFQVARAAAWEPGANAAGAGRGFAAQVDLAALFVERSLDLLSPGGTMALLLPVKLWRSLAGGGVRRLLADDTQLVRLEDHSRASTTFDAAVYPSLIVARRRTRDHAVRSPVLDASVHDTASCALAWSVPAKHLPFDASRGSPWILLPPDARRGFDLLRGLGRPLTESELGRPRLGVKCGFNAAFVVEILGVDDDLVDVLTLDRKRTTIERAMLRPLLRGESLRRWSVPPSTDAIIWTHDAFGGALRSLPLRTSRWMSGWRRQLAARADAREKPQWWSLFRTEAAAADRPRVVWGDVGREPRASVLLAGDPRVPLNTCYVSRCRDARDAFALAALLNGPLARAWLDSLAEPARGGYRRYLGWTMSLLPVPSDWNRARDVLGPLGEAGARGKAPSDQELLDAALAAYGADRREMAAMIAWMGG
ncbi:MAG TPA: N-6 DNA methylase [Gemmatimonadaceae bacterium]|nr:N-6 DNA methylase [Gemmatimonadaceae bacterium]